MKLLIVPLSLALACPLTVLGSIGQNNNGDQNSKELAQWIMGIVLQKNRENEKLKREHVVYDKIVVKSDLERNPPQEKEKLVYGIYGQNGQSMERLKEKNGKPVRNARPEPGKINFSELVLERYELNLEREVLIDGRGYYIISFRPKNEQLPFNDRMDEGINRTIGHIYVDMEKFYLKRLEGKLIGSFTRGMAIFEMKEFSIEFEQEEFEGIVVPEKMVLIYKYRVFWGDTHEKLEYLYSNRQKI